MNGHGLPRRASRRGMIRLVSAALDAAAAAVRERTDDEPRGITAEELVRRVNVGRYSRPLKPAELERWLIVSGFATVDGYGRLHLTSLGGRVASAFAEDVRPRDELER